MSCLDVSNYRPQGYAALGRSTFLKPPALREIADNVFMNHDCFPWLVGTVGAGLRVKTSILVIVLAQAWWFHSLATAARVIPTAVYDSGALAWWRSSRTRIERGVGLQ
jgi:hypothetical protein